MMVNIGKIKLGSIPQIALAVGEYSENLTDAYPNGVSILEVRIDLFPRYDWEYVKSQLGSFKTLGMPLIATIRPECEKGKWNQSETSRKELFHKVINLVDAIDIELSSDEINKSVSDYCKDAGKTLIVSNHDFEKTPSNSVLSQQVDKAKKLGADIVKLACESENQDDVTRLLDFVKENREKGLIGISMGSIGSISRIVAPLFGSLITYASMEPNYGQLPLTHLVDISRLLYPSYNQDLIISRERLEMV